MVEGEFVVEIPENAIPPSLKERFPEELTSLWSDKASRLEISLIFNLCTHKDKKGWKNSKQIRETNKYFMHNPSFYELLYFTSSHANLDNVMKKLIKKGLVEKGLKQGKRVWRLKRNRTIIRYLWNIAGVQDMSNLDKGMDGEILINFLTESDYFKNCPIPVKWDFMNETLQIMILCMRLAKDKALKDYEKYKTDLDKLESLNKE